MARLLEDSDDEFPDLAELIRGAKSGTTSKKQLSRQCLRKKQPGHVDEDEVDANFSIGINSREKLKAMVANGTPKGQEAGARGDGNKKPKKRILKQRADNPLLRPFSSTSINVASSELHGEERRRRAKTTTTKRGAEKKLAKGWSKPMEILSSDGEDLDEGADGLEKRHTEISNGNETRKAPKRSKSKPPPKFESDEEDLALDSDGTFGFIVNDSICLEVEDSVDEKPPPKSFRRLVKGRKPATGEVAEDELNLRMKKLALNDNAYNLLMNQSMEKDLGDFAASCSDHETSPQSSRSSRPPTGGLSQLVRSDKMVSKSSSQLPPSSDVEDPFTLRYSPSESQPRKVFEGVRFLTPPESPELKPKKLKSPTKKIPQIPATPHRPSMDSFWSQDVINEWNDEFSPQKSIKAPRLNKDDASEGRLLFSPKKSPMKRDKAIRDAKKAFSEKKHAIAESFLIELDNVLTDGQISKLSASTGGIQIIWSKKLNSTAGRANWKRETVKSLRIIDGKASTPTYRHHAAIELAEKVIDDEDRLLNVIAHEFCHLANFMISNIKTNPHGKEFKAWAARCSLNFGDRGIEVTTKHSYTINYKYVWECENCGSEFKRHSKSIDPKRHQCGSCKSKLVQTKPVPRNGGGEKKVSEYQVFVKENMSRVREENPGSPQKEIMGLVGKRYQASKAAKLQGEVKESVSEVVGTKEGTPESEDIGLVVRKLDLLDLTSP